MKKGVILSTISFLTGAVAGAGAAYLYFKKETKKVKKEAEEDISEARAVYLELCKELKGAEEETHRKIIPVFKDAEKTEVGAYYETVVDLYDSSEKSENSSVYIIPSEEYGIIDGYESLCLDWYSDGVLTDLYGDEITDPEIVIGSEAIRLLTDTDAEILYVRNEVLGKEYEVVKDYRSWASLEINPARDEEEYDV